MLICKTGSRNSELVANGATVGFWFGYLNSHVENKLPWRDSFLSSLQSFICARYAPRILDVISEEFNYLNYSGFSWRALRFVLRGSKPQHAKAPCLLLALRCTLK